MCIGTNTVEVQRFDIAAMENCQEDNCNAFALPMFQCEMTFSHKYLRELGPEARDQ